MKFPQPGHVVSVVVSAMMAILLMSFPPASAQTAAQNTAQGSITVDGKKTEFRHAYTYRTPEQGKDKAETILIFSDKPLPPDAVVDKLDRMVARDKDNVQIFEVTFNDTKELGMATFRLDGFSTGAFASAFKTTFDAFGPKSLKGRLTTAGEQKSFGNVYSMDVRFEAVATVPRAPDAAGKKAWDSVQGKVLTAYLRAVQAGDKAAIKRTVVPEVAQALDSPEADRAMKAMKAFAADPKRTDIEGLFISGDTAKVKLAELTDGRKAYTSKNLRRVGENWFVVP
jgi:hypothetical protein